MVIDCVHDVVCEIPGIGGVDMRMSVEELSVCVVLSWEEAVVLGTALGAGENDDDAEFAERVGVGWPVVGFIRGVLCGKKGRFLGAVEIRPDPGRGEFSVHVERTAEDVSVMMSHGSARVVGAALEEGFRVAGSRAEYYMRNGLSLPLMERVATALTIQETGVIEESLTWGDVFVDAPPIPWPPKGVRRQRAYIVVRTDEQIGDGTRSHVVASAWTRAEDASSEAEVMAASVATQSGSAMRSWVQATGAGLTGRPESVPGDGIGKALFLVAARDTGYSGSLKGWLWWSRADAQREVERWNERAGPQATPPYEVWPTVLRG